MIGVIADDVTGATDVAAALSRAGLRTLLSLSTDIDIDIDPDATMGTEADAIVIGLKTRSIAVADARAQSIDALKALQRVGADSFYVKYCSTFDSTPEGNIGPVTESVAEALGVTTVVTTPAAPLHGRTVYQGYLFVDGQLLHETHMREHPVTPMLDSSIPRLLSPQVSGSVRTLPLEAVREGADSVRAMITAATELEMTHLVVDAVAESDLAVIAEAVDSMILVAGSAGLIGAMALRRESQSATIAAPPEGRTAILAGSCSARTLTQVDRFRESGGAAYQLVAEPGETAEELARAALAWWDTQSAEASAMIYSSSPAAERDPRIPDAGVLYERAAGLIAEQLSDRGLRRMLIAGGETSGEVVKALEMRTAVVGVEAALGAPWIYDAARDLHLVLKSGNFGEPDFFVDVARSGEAR